MSGAPQKTRIVPVVRSLGSLFGSSAVLSAACSALLLGALGLAGCAGQKANGGWEVEKDSPLGSARITGDGKRLFCRDEPVKGFTFPQRRCRIEGEAKPRVPPPKKVGANEPPEVIPDGLVLTADGYLLRCKREHKVGTNVPRLICYNEEEMRQRSEADSNEMMRWSMRPGYRPQREQRSAPRPGTATF